MGGSLYRQLGKILEGAECSLIREGKGSHEIWRSPITGKHFSVPVTIKANPTANAILRQAGIQHKL
ncbi:MAG: type II toxin-antitoxin system HicA family toxin [Thiohalocapsa sp.]